MPRATVSKTIVPARDCHVASLLAMTCTVVPARGRTHRCAPTGRNELTDKSEFALRCLMRNTISISQETDFMHGFGHFDEGRRSASKKVALRTVKFRRKSAFSEQFRQFFPKNSLHNICYAKAKQIMGTEFLLCIHVYIQQNFPLSENVGRNYCLQMHSFAHYAQACAQANKK